MLGLDPVQLEWRYLALYSVYTAHMGQKSEAAQVATKHVISDLQNEAAAWDTVPPPPLVALEIIVNTVNYAAATLQSSARFLSGAVQKSLLTQFKALAQ